MHRLIDPTHLDDLVRVAGALHFAILLASAMVPQVLDWKQELRRLQPLTRQLVWVHGSFIVGIIIGFGVLSLVFADEMASGQPLARGLCAFIALFWGIRLVLQFTVFDASEHLSNPLLRIGYHGLTVVFVLLTVIYSVAAVQG